MQVRRKTKKIVLGIIVILIGIIIGIIPFFEDSKEINDENTKIEDYINSTSQIINNDNLNIDKTEKSDDSKIKTDDEEYLLILEIPKISLKRGVYPFNSKLNTIEKNVEIMKESSLPTDNFGNVVLEAHNGTAKISYFRELYKLRKSDIAYIYYHGIKYTYIVDNIYDVEKDGTVEIYRDVDRNTLTLITCKRNTNDRQLVVILYLLNKEQY